jgi:YHS domain-containing protein
MRRATLAALMLVLLTIPVLAAPRDSGEAVHVDRRNRAAQGMDVVAYWTLEVGAAPVRGREEFSYQWRGATWLFASQENLDAFKTDPERYAPQYGAYCSNAMSQNTLAAVDARVWLIQDDELFLFARQKGRESWLTDPSGAEDRADENWPGQRDRLLRAAP